MIHFRGNLNLKASNRKMDARFRFTSKPSQPHCGTFKPDLAVFINLDMLITNLLSFFPAVASLSSTSASKFEFLELLLHGPWTGWWNCDTGEND